MEGPDATKAIRALGYKGHIFGCTGNAVMSDQEHFVKCGAKYVSFGLVVTPLVCFLLNVSYICSPTRTNTTPSTGDGCAARC